jgi:hypothetical protein
MYSGGMKQAEDRFICAVVVGIFLAPFVQYTLLLLFAALGWVLIVLGLWTGGYGPD